MKRFGALFDLDGVIIDSESGYTRFWTDLDQIYPSGIPDYGMSIKGMTLAKILGNYPAEDVRQDIIRRLHDFEATMAYLVYPGVRNLLRRLADKGIPAAIVTSSDDVKIGHLRSQHPWLLDMFDVVIDASQVTRSKPDPQGYLMAAAALGVAAADCIVFEDSIQGLKAGRASGARVVGIATTYPAAELYGLADRVVESIADLDADDLYG